MSITTFAELQTAIANWSARGDSDIAARSVEAIALAEAKINRKLRTLDMVTKNATFSITGEYVATPTSFGGAKAFYLNTSPTVTLEQKSDEQITEQYGGLSGTPEAFCVQGANFRFGPIPSSATSSTLVYWLKVPALSVSNTTNWLLTSHPDAYLYLSLAELQAKVGAFDVANSWEMMGYKILDEVAGQSNRDRWGGMALVTRPG